jgi:hypothetical protein
LVEVRGETPAFLRFQRLRRVRALAQTQFIARVLTHAGTLTGTVTGQGGAGGQGFGAAGGTGGGTAPIVWLGHRHVDCRQPKRPEKSWAFRVHAGAFGEATPRHDVLLSPDHAVFTGGALIPVRCLVNGRTIVRECRDQVTYWHVELLEHSVILAEGLPVESYLDTGDRANLRENGEETIRLLPDFSAHPRPDAAQVWEILGTAPLVLLGEGLASARRTCALRPVSGSAAIALSP